MFTDSREQLVEVCCQLLCCVLETNISLNKDQMDFSNEDRNGNDSANANANLFISYISRIHRDEVRKIKAQNKFII